MPLLHEPFPERGNVPTSLYLKPDTGLALTILVADDDSEERTLIREMLETLDHEVVEACDGTAVQSLCRDVSPDIVILDLLMPEQEGIETLRMLKRDVPAIRTAANSVNRVASLSENPA
jgi:CheY-like chemotaxis protein